MGTMALTGAPLYGKMLRRLLDSPEPLLFHCSAGKDRTGLSAALLMRILGVNEEAIVADYLLVNQLMPPENGPSPAAGPSRGARCRAPRSQPLHDPTGSGRVPRSDTG